MYVKTEVPITKLAVTVLLIGHTICVKINLHNSLIMYLSGGLYDSDLSGRVSQNLLMTAIIFYIVYTISCTFLMILYNTVTDGRVHCPERRVRSMHCVCMFDNKLRTSDDC